MAAELFQALYQKFQRNFLSVEEVAGELGVATGTFRNWLSKGVSPLPPSILIYGKRVFPIQGLVEFSTAAVSGKPLASASAALPDAQVKKIKKSAGAPRKTAALSKAVRHG